MLLVKVMSWLKKVVKEGVRDSSVVLFSHTIVKTLEKAIVHTGTYSPLSHCSRNGKTQVLLLSDLGSCGSHKFLLSERLQFNSLTTPFF